jgi:hypothetical protein
LLIEEPDPVSDLELGVPDLPDPFVVSVVPVLVVVEFSVDSVVGLLVVSGVRELEPGQPRRVSSPLRPVPERVEEPAGKPDVVEP